MARNPNYAPIAFDFVSIGVSVSTSASAIAAQVGPFAGLFFKTSASLTIISLNNTSLAVDNVVKNTTLWIQGNYISALSTSVIGII